MTMDGMPSTTAKSNREEAVPTLRKRLEAIRNRPFGLMISNIIHMFTGNIANTALMLISTVIAARALGVQDYGLFALILTVGRFSERIIRFESWQPLIKFAADEEQNFDSERLGSLFLYGLLLDCASCLAAGFLTIALGAGLSSKIGLEPEHLVPVAIYACAIALNIRGFPTAAMRLGGRFRTLAYLQTVSSFVRIILALLAWHLDLGLTTFVIAWSLAQVLDTALFMTMSFGILKAQGIDNPLRSNWRGLRERFPGFIQFAWSTNLSSTLRTLTQEADTLLVAALAGSSAAGFYHIAKRISKGAMQIGANVQAVIYPEMARMSARLEIAELRRLTWRVQLVLAAIGGTCLIACLIVGEWAIDLVFGREFNDAYILLVAQLVAVALILHSAPSRSTLLAMGKPGFVLVVSIFSTILFFVVSIVTMPKFGALGASFGHIAFSALTAIALDFAWRWQARRAL